MTLAACGGDDGSSSDVVATVNGTDITTEQVDAQYEIFSQNAGTPPPDTSEDDYEQQQRTNGLNQLIFAQILVDNADEMDIEVSEEDITATRDSLITQYGGEDELYSALEEQGMDREEVDRQIEILTTQDAVIADLAEDVTDEEVQTAYDEGAPARHILVEDEAAANDALDRIESGEDFADVASDVSTDQASAANGGELGFSQPGSFVPEFEEALFNADEGEVVGPVETQFGFHIIERMPKPDLAEVEEQIRGQLEQENSRAAEQEFGQLIQQWVQDAEVTVHDTAYGEWDPQNGVVPPGGGSTEAPAPENNDSGDSNSGSGDDESGDDGSGDDETGE